MQIPEIALKAISPEIILVLAAFLVLGTDLVWPRVPRGTLAILSFLGLLVTFGVLLFLWERPMSTFEGMFINDPFALFFKTIFLMSALLTVAISPKFINLYGMRLAEYYPLLMLSTLGMMLMASAGDLLALYLGLELMAMSIYILVGFLRAHPKSNEASIKYFLLGAFASGLLVYGISILYGITGSTNLRIIGAFLGQEGLEMPRALTLSLLLITTGFGFKIAAVPFHMWVPDVYEGAPTPVTAFMSVGPKAAGFAVILRVYLLAFPSIKADWSLLFIILSILTMTVGNLVAIAQQNIKRMLAYSSIAHAGYLLIGFVSAGYAKEQAVAVEALASMLIYLFAYLFMNIGAFGVVIALASKERAGEELKDFIGLARREPTLSFLMLVLLLSLMGIPPTLGFVGKFYIFASAIRADLAWLAVIGVLNSVVAAFYYIRVVVYMYFREPEEGAYREAGLASFSVTLMFAISFMVAVTLCLGLMPGSLIDLARWAIPSIMG